jgi:hypothetical protein
VRSLGLNPCTAKKQNKSLISIKQISKVLENWRNEKGLKKKGISRLKIMVGYRERKSVFVLWDFC